MSKKSASEPLNLSYEQAFHELEQIVEALETNQQPLEESMQLFERGQLLAQHCASLLDKAELKVRTLTSNDPTAEEIDQ